jgi:hypothetical protein
VLKGIWRLLRDASKGAAGSSCDGDESGQGQPNDIRLDARAAGVAADGRHRSVVAVLPSSLGEPACGEGLHVGSVTGSWRAANAVLGLQPIDGVGALLGS